MQRCPGQDFRNLTVSEIKCPHCGTEVEIFSHENSVKCHVCGQRISRETLPSCIRWCTAARQCVGEKRWKELGLDDKQ
jgi:Fe-S-cluster-containing dehydrogenase component